MPTVSTASSPQKTALLWTLQIITAALFLAAGGMKIAGLPMMVAIFDHIGFGQWFRFVTGAVEIVGGLLLLTSRTAPFGAALLVATMTCAIFTHLLLIGGSPVPALVLLILNAAILWLRRAQVAGLSRAADA